MFNAIGTLECYLDMELCRELAAQLLNTDARSIGERKLLAIYLHLDVSIDDIVKVSHDYYGMTLFKVWDAEYAVGTDREVKLARIEGAPGILSIHKTDQTCHEFYISQVN